MLNGSSQHNAVATCRISFFMLFATGAIVHLAYLFLLIQLAPIEEWNWESGDTRSYLVPAESFLREGAFLNKGVPDYRRTIGYPIFLSGMIKISNTVNADFRITIYVAQAIVFAVVYPIIYFLGITLFNLRRTLALFGVVCTMLSGAFISYVPMILSDALFATTLVAGVACGIVALKNQSFLWASVYIMLVLYAANVRPMLAFFPIAMLLLQLSWTREKFINIDLRTRNLMIYMFVVSIFVVHTPAARNYINYNVFTPTEIGSINLFRYVGKDVLNYKGEHDRYAVKFKEINSLDQPDHLEERINLRRNEALNIFKEYPVETIGFLAYNTVLNSIEMHWQNFCFIFNKTWYQDYADGTVKWSPVPFFAALLFICFYGFVYITIMLSIFLWKENFLLLVGLIIFAIPYAFCGTSYQGGRFRLWLEPFMLMLFLSAVQNFLFCKTSCSLENNSSPIKIDNAANKFGLG